MNKTDYQLLTDAKNRWKKRNENSYNLSVARFDYTKEKDAAKAAAKSQPGVVIQKNADARGGYWDVSGGIKGKKLTVTKQVQVTDYDADGNPTGKPYMVVLKNAEVGKIRQEDGQLKAEITGKVGTGADAKEIVKEIPFTRALYNSFRSLPGNPDLDEYQTKYEAGTAPVVGEPAQDNNTWTPPNPKK